MTKKKIETLDDLEKELSDLKAWKEKIEADMVLIKNYETAEPMQKEYDHICKKLEDLEEKRMQETEQIISNEKN